MRIGNLSIVYGVVAMLSALLYITYILFNKKKNRLFLLLFGFITVANSGYFLLSVCRSLAVARIANGLSYFGSAFSLLMMLYIIYEVCQLHKRKWLVWLSLCFTFTLFSLAASGDLFGLYYRSIDLEFTDGVTHLVKEYGPLHKLYALHLVVYVVAMLVIIGYAAKTKRLFSPKYVLFLLVAVLLNVGVWLVEQAFVEEFEFLSVSYIVTAVLLLLIYNILYDYGIIQPSGRVISVQMLTQIITRQVDPGALPSGMEDMLKAFADKAKTLSSAERRVLQYYIEGYDVTDIPGLTYVSVHTVKKHNHNIYQKLEIASRDELMLYIEMFRCCDRLDELSGEQAELEKNDSESAQI